VGGFGISGVEPSGSSTRQLVGWSNALSVILVHESNSDKIDGDVNNLEEHSQADMTVGYKQYLQSIFSSRSTVTEYGKEGSGTGNRRQPPQNSQMPHYVFFKKT